MDKVTTLENSEEFRVETTKEKEMELVDVSEFESKNCIKIEKTDLEEIYALASEMVKFTHARGGVGLALPQIGIMKRGFVFLDKEDQWQMIINPEFFGSGKKAVVYERSLSFDGIYAVPRYKRINVVYYTIDVDKNDRLTLRKNTKMMSGLKGFVFQMLTQLLDGKTARILGTYIEVEEKKDVDEKQQE